MKGYLVHFYSKADEYTSCRSFNSQSELKAYLEKLNASYDVHFLSSLGEDLLKIEKINLDGGYIEIEELALPRRTDSLTIDGIDYISIDGAVKKYDMSLSQIKYAKKSKSLKFFSAGSMGRVFIEDKFSRT